MTTVMFLVSLLAHELAHTPVARRCGVTVKTITLWLFGRISELGGEAPSPAAEAERRRGGADQLLLGGIFIALAALVGTSPRRAPAFQESSTSPWSTSG